MNIKPLNRTKGVLSSARSPHVLRNQPKNNSKEPSAPEKIKLEKSRDLIG